MNSFLQGKKSLASAALRAPVHAGTHPIARSLSPSQAPAPSTQVEAVKEGDKVVRLIITCACGERTEIDCIYPVGS